MQNLVLLLQNKAFIRAKMNNNNKTLFTPCLRLYNSSFINCVVGVLVISKNMSLCYKKTCPIYHIDIKTKNKFNSLFPDFSHRCEFLETARLPLARSN